MCVSDINCGLGCYGTRLVRWGDDLISEPADYTDDLLDDELNGVSDSVDVWARTTPKDKFTSSIVADKNYLYDFKIIPPLLQVSVIDKSHEKSCTFTLASRISLLFYQNNTFMTKIIYSLNI